MLDDCREAAAAAVFLLPARRAEPPWLVCAVPVIFIFIFSGELSNFWRQISTFLQGQDTITNSVFFFQFCEFESLAII